MYLVIYILIYLYTYILYTRWPHPGVYIYIAPSPLPIPTRPNLLGAAICTPIWPTTFNMDTRAIYLLKGPHSTCPQPYYFNI